MIYAPVRNAALGSIAFSLALALAGCGGSGGGGSSGSPCGLASEAAGFTGNGAGTALLSWIPPTTRTDGSALTDLAGYCTYYGTAPNTLNHVIEIRNPGQTSQFIDGLDSGQWFFAATAFCRKGLESRMSNIVSKTIP